MGYPTRPSKTSGNGMTPEKGRLSQDETRAFPGEKEIISFRLAGQAGLLLIDYS